MLDPKTQKILDDAKRKYEGSVKSKPRIDAEECPKGAHEGQVKVWDNEEDLTIAVAGAQAGKTRIGAYWLRREIQRTARLITSPFDPPNDYLVAGPTIRLLKNRALDTFLSLFPDDGVFGKFNKADNIYTFEPDGQRALLGFETPIKVYFGYAASPDSLESMTIKAAWLDEAGQQEFKRESWNAINRRFATTGGRILITTTPYSVYGWLREECERLEGTSSLVQFKTLDNPAVASDPDKVARILAERDRLAPYKYEMMYEGNWKVVPPGAVYDCFRRESHTCERFPIPTDWKLFWGMDFGPVHTCVSMWAQDPKETVVKNSDGTEERFHRLYMYASYLPAEQGEGRRSFDEHAEAIKLKSMQCMADRKHREPFRVYGGAKNEDSQRIQYHRRGIRVIPPMFENDVVTQIECTYGAYKRGMLCIMDDLEPVIVETETYSYSIDEEQRVDDTKIIDKAQKHRMDAKRYVVASVFPGKRTETRVVERAVKRRQPDALPFRM